MTEDKGDSFLLTQVREPLPGEHTLDADDEILSIGRNHPQQGFGCRRQIFVDEFRAVLIQDTDVHGAGV